MVTRLRPRSPLAKSPWRALLTLACAAPLAAGPRAQSGDLLASRIGADANDFTVVALEPERVAVAMGVTACNLGDAPLDWTSLSALHPVLGQQAYVASADGRRFEQLGAAWVLHEFCALNEAGCATCGPTDCSTLGAGCATTHSANLLTPPFLGARDEIDVARGQNSHPDVTFGRSGGDPFDSALTISLTAIGAGAGQVFFELQYASADDSAAGRHGNNASHRPVSLSAGGALVLGLGPTVVGEPALFAWRAIEPAVVIEPALVLDEGGPGVHGIFHVAHLVTDNGDGTWDYEYALHNQTSSREAGSFTVPIPAGVTLTEIGFHDVDHVGVGSQPGDDWTSALSGTSLTWSTAVNPVAWGTLYNFRFTADTPPVGTIATIGLFEAGVPASITGTAQGPSAPAGGPGTPFCFGDGSGNACPCGNVGAAGEGCATSTGSGMTIAASGSTSLASDDMTLTAEGVPIGNTGIFYAGQTSFAGGPLFDGLQCAGGSTLRFSGQLASTSTVSDTNLVAQDLFGLFWNAGTTYHFQYFSRDNQTGSSPCSGFANLSHGLSVTMTP